MNSFLNAQSTETVAKNRTICDESVWCLNVFVSRKQLNSYFMKNKLIEYSDRCIYRTNTITTSLTGGCRKAKPFSLTTKTCTKGDHCGQMATGSAE